LVSLINTVNVFLFGVIWSFFQPWTPVQSDAWIWIIGAAALVVFAYICSIMTVRTGEVSAVAPFRYTGLLMALILGWLVFDEWPNTMALIGGLIVVISGVYALWREALAGRKIAKGNGC
jgi:drug/metabolite transporter (DMT)-like permease